jgi:hypothetical protein
MKRKEMKRGPDRHPKNLPGNRDLNQAKRWGGWVGKKEKEKRIAPKMRS